MMKFDGVYKLKIVNIDDQKSYSPGVVLGS